jgi:hypothetical protein
VELARLGAERQADMLQQARELLITLRRVPEIAAPDPGDCRATVKGARLTRRPYRAC